MTTTTQRLQYFPWPVNGRWAVCYQVPGTDTKHAVCDCPTLESALREARERNGGSQGRERQMARSRAA